MTTVPLFAKGLLLGFSVAAPVGPIGMLCIRRTLAHGRLAGLATGLGAATADAFYGLVAGLGLVALSQWLMAGEMVLRLIGGLILGWMGLKLLRPRTPADEGAPVVDPIGAGWAYASSLGLTLTNPATILSFATLFLGLGLTGTAGPTAAVTLVVGVFAGSAAWWLFLSGITSRLHRHLPPGTFAWIDRGAGLMFLGLGLVTLTSVWR